MRHRDPFIQAMPSAEFEALPILPGEGDDLVEIGPEEGPIRKETPPNDRIAPELALIEQAIDDGCGIITDIDTVRPLAGKRVMVDEGKVPKADFPRQACHQCRKFLARRDLPQRAKQIIGQGCQLARVTDQGKPGVAPPIGPLDGTSGEYRRRWKAFHHS